MPFFGEYETVGEPMAVAKESGHVTTVWKARKCGTTGAGVDYVVKIYAPHRKSACGQSEDKLDRDRGLEFLEGVKQLKQAAVGGARCLTLIHAFGTSNEGAWYVTDYFQRGSLAGYIGRVKVDANALRQIVRCLVTGCLDLKRLRGISHGNLKPSNVLLVGQTRALRKTPLVLADAYPAAPLQLASLETEDRRAAGLLLRQAMEAQDLRAIGEIVLELVQGRAYSSSDQYNYPVPRSAGWDNLGKDSENWLQLCNQLLDPNLSPDKINLESLAKRFPAGGGSGKILFATGATVSVCLLATGIYWGINWFGKMGEKNYRNALQVATNAFVAGNYLEAQKKVDDALKRKPEGSDARGFSKQIGEKMENQFTNTLRYAEGQLGATNFGAVETALIELRKLKSADQRIDELDAKIAEAKKRKKVAEIVAGKRDRLKQLLADGRDAAGKPDLIKATNLFAQAQSLATELDDTRAGGAAQVGLKTAIQNLAQLTQKQQWTAQFENWMGAGRAAMNTNGWNEATNFLRQAKALADNHLQDQTLVKRADSELQTAEAGLAKFHSEKEVRDQIKGWLDRARLDESQSPKPDWNAASNANAKALSKASELKDEALIAAAKAGIERASHGLKAEENTQRMKHAFEDLLNAGQAAMVTNGWRAATNLLSHARAQAQELQDAALINKVDSQMAQAQGGLKIWDLINDGGLAAQGARWEAASNSFAAALEKSKQPGFSQLNNAASQGLSNALTCLSVESLIQRGDLAGRTNGWRDASNFFGQAVRSVATLTYLKAASLSSNAEQRYQHAVTNLNAQIASEHEIQTREQAYNTAKHYFDLGKYIDAAQACGDYAGSDDRFKNLVQEIGVQRAALDAASAKFSKGDYSFISGLADRNYNTNPPFTDLLRNGDQEKKTFDELDKLIQAGDWKAFLKKWPDLPPAVSGKDSFKVLHGLATDKAADNQRMINAKVDQLNKELECFKVWFKVAPDPSAHPLNPSWHPEAGKKAVFRTVALSPQEIDFYQGKLNDLKKEYSNTSPDSLTPNLETFRKLSEKIRNFY